MKETVLGDDAFCAPAQDLAACQDLGSRCMPDSADPIYDMCVANPNPDGGSSTLGGAVVPPPSLDDASMNKCENLDEEFFAHNCDRLSCTQSA